MVRPFVGHVVAYLFRPKARKFVPLSSAFVLVRPCTGNHGGAMTRSAPDRLFQVERVDLAARERLFHFEMAAWTAPAKLFHSATALLDRAGPLFQPAKPDPNRQDRSAWLKSDGYCR